MALIRAAIFAALSLWGIACFAQDVTLTSPDGQVELSGTLLGFDGEFYRIETIYGELTVDGSGVLCEGPACPNLQDFVAEISVSGSSTMGAVLMPALIEGFALRNNYTASREVVDARNFTYTLLDTDSGKPVARFYFHVSTTDEGFADLLANDADIVMALREIRPDERQRARDAGMGDMTEANRSRVLALDAMVPIVSPSNPVDRISPQDLASVFAGRITNWTDLGGADAPIALHLPGARTGLGQSVEDDVMGPARSTFAEGIERHDRGLDVVNAVLRDPFAIGIASYADTGDARALTLTGACGFSLSAARGTIKTEDYPLTAPMFLYLPARRLPKIGREFLAFTRGPSAQVVIRRAGFVDQAPEEVSINDQGYRFANAVTSAGPEVSLEELQRMTRTLYGMARLTTSFRFEAGSVRLDAQSRSNVQQLARALEQGKYDARQILLVGFSDGDGPAAANRDIAMRRAEAVRRAVETAAQTANFERFQMDVDAFGEALPMACDDSAWGRQANRRVEVWVR
ncbi:phosphate ABC transporter substrate-binding/OmpA family protein [Tateyamaria sp. ANG-S1]|uniref:phosphate ABC transporter substrate-binding/OmpA family protein n=1 Tax=Tateyamaria sp. ANG-S1 TaxID=1577905 RepID=UPI00057C6AB0|nr:phosphate ABC transporter substrate-binding/OmpA family protein [Tateyamaria sp. ANG-S1]KIC49835.1 cell envelope biogenesis protein OmpA [Tateyamaria sp. ANG-S1]